MGNIVIFIGVLFFLGFFVFSPLIFKLSLKILKKENISYWKILLFQSLLLIGISIIFFVVGSIFNMSGILGILIILISFFILLFLLLKFFKLKGVFLVLLIYTMFSFLYLIGYYYLLSNNNTYEYVAKMNLESNSSIQKLGNSNYDIEIGNLINIKGDKGELMRIPENKDLELITARMNNSIIKNHSWYYGYIKKYKTGILPYHKNLGITKEEYQKILDLGKTKLKKITDVELKFIKKDSKYILNTGGNKLEGLENLVIDLEESNVKTKYGNLYEYSSINNTNEDSPTGAWKGYQWKGVFSVDGGIIKVKFAIGKLSKNGKGIIYFDVVDSVYPEKSYYYVVTYNIN